MMRMVKIRDAPPCVRGAQAGVRALAESKHLMITSILFICGNMLAMAADHNCDLVEDGYCKGFKTQLEQASAPTEMYRGLGGAVRGLGNQNREKLAGRCKGLKAQLEQARAFSSAQTCRGFGGAGRGHA